MTITAKVTPAATTVADTTVTEHSGEDYRPRMSLLAPVDFLRVFCYSMSIVGFGFWSIVLSRRTARGRCTIALAQFRVTGAQ